MVGGNMSLKNPVRTPGIDPGTVRLVAQRLKHYATPSPDAHSRGTNLFYIIKCEEEERMIINKELEWAWGKVLA
jgi:hypothetical protein